MYSRGPIEIENEKVIRKPFDLELWMSNDYYDVLSNSTRIGIIVPSDSTPIGTVSYSIPGDCYYYQAYSSSSSQSSKHINFTDLCKIAKSRCYPLTYGYNPSDYDTSAKRTTFQNEFNHAQNWATYNWSDSMTIQIEAVTASTQRKRMLVLALKDWADDTEFTISLGTGFSKTYIGSEIVNNNIIIDLYGKANTATTATLTWINRAGATVAAFAQNYIYYINKRNLISAEAHLRSDLSVNASTIPSSQINVTALGDETMYKLYNISSIYNNHLFYVCGYKDYKIVPSSTSSTTVLTPRRFNVTSDLKYQNNTIQIEAEDGISDLYNVNMGGLIYTGTFASLFNDYMYPESNNEFRQYIDYSSNVPKTRFQFIFWLMLYSYFYALWGKHQDMAKSIVSNFKYDFRNFLKSTSDYAEYSGSWSIYDKSGYLSPVSHRQDTPYLAAINDTAPLPLMAWIQDAWHGNVTFRDYHEGSVFTVTRYFRPQFVDAGRPTFSFNVNEPVIEIKEADVTDIAEIIEIPKKKMILPKKSLMAGFEKYGWHPDSETPDQREAFFNFTKEPGPSSGYQDINVYNYNKGFHYYCAARHTFTKNIEGTDTTLVAEKLPHEPFNPLSNEYKGILWTDFTFRYNCPITFYDDTVPTEWDIIGYSLIEQQSQSELTNSAVEDGEDIRVEYENYMGQIIDNDLAKASMLGRSNKTGQFTWRGDPRLQPRDIFKFTRLDGTYVNCTIETIETRHEGGGTTQTITYREGIV